MYSITYATSAQKEIKKMQGYRDIYRIRQGDYRVVYRVNDAFLVVLVIAVGHRKVIYN
jgi:mRNA interferase RelE/StbE